MALASQRLLCQLDSRHDHALSLSCIQLRIAPVAGELGGRDSDNERSAWYAPTRIGQTAVIGRLTSLQMLQACKMSGKLQAAKLQSRKQPVGSPKLLL